MTPKEQRIAMAKLLIGKDVCSCGLHWLQSDKLSCGNSVPDYLNDLNACHKAEMVLTDEQQRRYAAELGRGYDGSFLHVCATAAQRCKALLRALNLWTE